MDAGVEPDGRAVGASRAELGEKTDSSTSNSVTSSPSCALGCVVCPPSPSWGFWCYLQDVQRAFLVGFADLDLLHEAVLGCKVVQLLIDLQ